MPVVPCTMAGGHETDRAALYAERALAAGANGYIMKHAAMAHLIDAIRCVASGRTYVSPQMSERIVTP